ncbi:MAG: 23S rRNA (uracil(1939)-C(5))-methyltransferase RlmD [Erysipelotrichaceae bacterium]|nr:23S rRNA (uracil(1939)-C(5))-methyltransferase RlmD [Erysipelotrichaceae bacterium]
MIKLIDMRLVGKCLGYSSEGKGIIKEQGLIVFVKGLFLNEVAEIEITYQGKDVCYGKIIKLLTLSPQRIVPHCKVGTACGGCVFQALAYESELKFKQDKVQEDLIRIGNIKKDVAAIVPCQNLLHYRNKIQVPLQNIKGKVTYGFYREFSHSLVTFEECFIENKAANEVIKKTVSIINEFRYPAYDEDQKTGIFRHLLVRTSENFKEIMLVLVTAIDEFPGRNTFIKALMKQLPEVTTIIQNINVRTTNVILGTKERILFGSGFIKEKLSGLVFKIYPASFFQINLAQTELLYMKIKELLKLQGDEIVLDAYSGLGTIGMALSPYARQVISVENNEAAVQGAKESLRINNLKNVTIIQDDATRYLEQLANTPAKLDVIVLDPPRKGTTQAFIKAALKLKPKRIVYVSCDPATLARDLKDFVAQYEIKQIIPVDLFPRTYHVENCVLLTLKQ